MKKRLITFVLGLLVLTGFSQAQTEQSDTLRKDALNVFMQTNDYIKKELPFVNFVRDIGVADVYIISTSQRNGSGGYQYTYFLTGQKAFAGMGDTISYSSGPDDTQDVIRAKSVKTLKMGLMRYVLKTPMAEFMNIGFTQKVTETVSTDKWNSWVFRTSGSGYVNGQKARTSNSFSGNVAINRVTKDWKLSVSANVSYSKSKSSIASGTYISETNSSSVNGLLVKSLTDHWSVGIRSNGGSSSYNNQKSYFAVSPGIEYDIFPYSESTRRQLRIMYLVGFNRVNYVDTTIYNKIGESLGTHSLTAAYEVVEKWGSIEVSTTYSNYLHDWSKNNLYVYGYLSLRIAKGLSVSLSASTSLIHDQLGLPKGGASDQEILLQTKRLATQYQYSSSFGLSYTFGSIYNNAVNPRFGD